MQLFAKKILTVFALVTVVALLSVIQTKVFHTRVLPESIEETLVDTVETAVSTVSAPSPIIVRKPSRTAPKLTNEGIFSWTNTRRSGEGVLPVFLPNRDLDRIAKERLDDLFARQYFDHIAPDGTGVSEVAASIGYDYLSIGENLALANAESDEVMVNLWMESPGHRANILSTTYTELGVAVRRGVFEGDETWIGVQIFGRPASDCPAPDALLLVGIEADKVRVDALKVRADELAVVLSDHPDSDVEIGPYNENVERYNALVAEINALIASIKERVMVYNEAVKAFNECVQ